MVEVTYKVKKELNYAKEKLDREKLKIIFQGGDEQIDNIGKAFYLYTNGKIEPKLIYKLYIRDYFFFLIDKDIYELYCHMKLRYNNILNEEEQMKIMGLIFINTIDPKFIIKELSEIENEIQYIKKTIQTTNENTNEGTMKGAVGRFGIEPTNPIPVNGHIGIREYFKNICLENGKDIVYEKSYSCMISDINGIVDMYIIYEKEKSEKVCELYVCIYNKYTSKLLPEKFKKKRVDN